MEKKTKTPKIPINCDGLKRDIPGTGGNILTSKARGYIDHLLAGWGDTTGKAHNFGYLFGLDKFNNFVDAVNDYNDNLEDDDLPIEGIRVFVGRSEATVAGQTPRECIMNTVFLMPVLQDGTDLSKVQPVDFVDPDIILGDPRPCPNQCLEAVSFYKKEN